MYDHFLLKFISMINSFWVCLKSLELCSVCKVLRCALSVTIHYIYRCSRPKVFLGKVTLKICSKFTGEHACRDAISIKLLNNFIETVLGHGCSPVNLLRVFRTPFPRSATWWLRLNIVIVKNVASRYQVASLE